MSLATCVMCSAPFTQRVGKGPPSVCCSDGCRKAKETTARKAWSESPEAKAYGAALRANRAAVVGMPRPRKCRDCKAPAGESRSPCAYCQECSARRLRDTNRRKNLKRRGVKTGTPYTLASIGARDRWCCHLCRKRVNPKLSGLHDRGPTIDHLIPVSAGGIDSAENVALAHRACNTKRNTGGTVQLRMVG